MRCDSLNSMKMNALKAIDPEIHELCLAEERRQIEKIRLIPSENYTSAAVLEASGTVLTNKYSEGYPGKRYYEGQQIIDQVERLAIERAKSLFGADHANVQPYSGSPANLAVYLALCPPGETGMGMALPHGGHLTHGWNVSITGKLWKSVQYGVRGETGRIDMDDVRRLAREAKPRVIFCGGTAIPRTIDFPAFAEIAKEVGAVLVADIAHIAGLVAGGSHPSPFGHADVVTTTTHKTLRGPRGGMILCRAEHAPAIDKAVFPGLQGGPHNHTAGRRRSSSRAGSTSSRAAPTTISSSSTSPPRESPASAPRRRWIGPASSAITTPCPLIRASPSIRRASASALPRSRHAA
jgi:glycine hydroxymethyltransferase